MLGRIACFVADSVNSAGRRVGALVPLALAFGLAGGIAHAACSGTPVTCTGGSGASVSGPATTGNYNAASPYPATLTVDNTVVGTVTSVSINFTTFAAVSSGTAFGTQGLSTDRWSRRTESPSTSSCEARGMATRV